MKNTTYLFITLVFLSLNVFSQKVIRQNGYMHVEKQNILQPDGSFFHIKGINLGNWLNPEGYLFLFGSSAASYRTIDQMLKELVGEAVTDEFWQKFQQNYVTREDIRYIRQTGMNTIRLPFHYKLLTDEQFMGYSSKKHGYALLDQVIDWCKQEGIYVVLDMHVAPGGQTGINIDDSYGYPWLLVTEKHKQQFCAIWREIATRYAKNTTVLGYDLLNEPIASSNFKKDTAMLNVELEKLLRRATKVVREADKNHIVILSGSTWGQDYSIFKDWKYDNNLMFTCHRYHSDSTELGIKDFLAYREKFNLPFWMGETGHEPDEWIANFTKMLNRNNIGWTYWPYKKMGNVVVEDEKPQSPWNSYSFRSRTSMVVINKPNEWKRIQDYINSDRNSFNKIIKNRPSQDSVKTILNAFIEGVKFERCSINEGYIKALGMKP